MIPYMPPPSPPRPASIKLCGHLWRSACTLRPLCVTSALLRFKRWQPVGGLGAEDGGIRGQLSILAPIGWAHARQRHWHNMEDYVKDISTAVAAGSARATHEGKRGAIASVPRYIRGETSLKCHQPTNSQMICLTANVNLLTIRRQKCHFQTVDCSPNRPSW